MLMHDIRLTLMFSAKTAEWRIYADNGHYWIAESLEELGEAVRKFLKNNARETNIMLHRDGDET